MSGLLTPPPRPRGGARRARTAPARRLLRLAERRQPDPPGVEPDAPPAAGCANGGEPAPRIAGAVLTLVAVVYPILGAAAPKGLAPLFLAAGALALFDPAVRRRLRAWVAAPRPGASFPLALAAGLAWLLATAIWALEPATSARLWPSLAVMSALGLALVAAGGVLDPRRSARIALLAAVGATAFAAFVAGEMETSGRITRALVAAWNQTTPWYSPMPTYANLLGPASATLAILAWPAAFALWRRSPWIGAAFVAAMAFVLLTQTMLASFVAFVAGVLAGALVWLWRRRGAMLVAAGIALANIALFVAAPLIVARIDSGALSLDLSASWIQRLYILAFALDRIAEHPVLGWGLDAARAVGRGVAGPYPGTSALPLHPHNLWAQIWLEAGAIGVALAAWLVWRVLAACARAGASPIARAAATGLAVTYLMIGNISYGAWQNWWLAVAWLGAALMAAATAGEGAAAPPSPPRPADRRARGGEGP